MTKYLGWFALIALAVVPYLPAIHAPLLYDDRTLLDNAWLNQEAGADSVFQHDYWHGTSHAGSDLYRPLTVLSLAWNVQAAPTREGVRAVNLLAHAGATVALCFMLATIAPRRAAFLAAALFAVHPLASEAVLWAVGRAEILAAAAGFAAFALFVRSRLALSVVAFFAALCFKESAAAWLLIGALWALHANIRVSFARIVCYLGTFAAYLVLRVSVVGWTRHDVPNVDNPLAGVDAATRASNAVLLFARYISKMLWPRTLSIEYGFDQIPVAHLLPWGALGALAIAAVTAAGVIVLQRRGRSTAAFLCAFVPAAFVVTGNLAFPIGTIFAERLAYLPLAGFCGLVGLAGAAIPKARLRTIALGVVLAACAGRTIVRGGDYKDVATLSQATVAASPRSVKALYNAGRTRLRQGDAAGASLLLQRAVLIWPDYAGAWGTLAEAYTALGDTARAAEAASRAHAAGAADPL